MKKNTIALLLSLATVPCVSTVNAQDDANRWYIGAGGGIHLSKLIYSDLDEDFFPENKSNLSGVFSVFAEFDFGKNNMFAIRPQFSFLTRGGTLNQIGSDYYQGYFNDPDIPEELLTDVRYSLKAQCFDFRLPLIWQIGNTGWKVRPYIYLAPIVSVVNNGYVAVSNHYGDGAFDGYKFDMSDANMASTIISGAVGAGLKYQFDISGNPFFLGLEFGYERSFTNTYGSKEKDGEANVVSFFPNVRKTVGTRTMQAFELQMSLGIPLSVFSPRKHVPVVEKTYEPEPLPKVVKQKKVKEPECYSLDEIINLLNAGRSVEGKKICAIDEINFDFGKSQISKSSYSYLNKLAKVLIRTNAKVVINGHTDNVGTEEYNLELSKKRAMAVRKYLISQGVNADKLTYNYYGMSRPLTDNDTEEGRKMNRRVEFELIK